MKTRASVLLLAEMLTESPCVAADRAAAAEEAEAGVGRRRELGSI